MSPYRLQSRGWKICRPLFSVMSPLSWRWPKKERQVLNNKSLTSDTDVLFFNTRRTTITELHSNNIISLNFFINAFSSTSPELPANSGSCLNFGDSPHCSGRKCLSSISSACSSHRRTYWMTVFLCCHLLPSPCRSFELILTSRIWPWAASFLLEVNVICDWDLFLDWPLISWGHFTECGLPLRVQSFFTEFVPRSYLS